MKSPNLQIDSIDFLSHERFIVYFSDNTCLIATAELLAHCFPQRQPALPRIHAAKAGDPPAGSITMPDA
ncbi:MAG: hypothetical protein HIU91_08185 [Acidobacteria bacterium]|nr:hypothetical protein [Acidobacteriota bacterium]